KFRLLHALDVLKSRFLVPFGKGWLDGFEFGRESSLFVHPIDNGKKLIAGTVDLILAASKILLKLALLTPQDVIQMITQTINALRAARNAAPSLMNLGPLFQAIGSYGAGYIVGLLCWMAFEFVTVAAATDG